MTGTVLHYDGKTGQFERRDITAERQAELDAIWAANAAREAAEKKRQDRQAAFAGVVGEQGHGEAIAKVVKALDAKEKGDATAWNRLVSDLDKADRDNPKEARRR